MAEINEWTFASDVCSTIERILNENGGLPFSRADVERGFKATRKRRDVTLYAKDGRPVLTGEIKLPDRPDGQSPYAAALVEDAFEKANQLGVEYFFTWNVNRFVLWKTFEAKKPVFERDLEHFNVTSIASAQDLLDARVLTEIRGFLAQFLGRFARILGGTEPILSKPLDEKFIRVIESALELPILQARTAIQSLYPGDRRFARALDSWMRDSQGWTLSSALLQENFDRAAKFSCYVLVNKLVFQQALRRRFPSLRKIKIPEKCSKAEELKTILEAYFQEAKRISRDYETVFDGDFGDNLPILEDASVSSWREFLKEIDGFDFGKIDYDIIGQIFERLIGPDERHRYGQHYTRSELVDLINAFAVRTAQGTVLDPACGGGTFLVRAYVQKRKLSNRTLAHEQLLRQIRGIDISAYAAHLSTINLASRDLIDERNYPLVARSDFFDLRQGSAVFHIPMSVKGGGKQMVPMNLDRVDSVVANPPYVRQELLSREYKARLRTLIKGEFPDARLSGRSDLHCYFWPHATSFLKEDGRLGFLTSSAWLDIGYGFRLQEWLLKNFAIEAFFESNCEPWFTGARVTTVATLLRREPDPKKRATNSVRFVQLHRPLKDVLSSLDSDPVLAAQKIRDFVEAQTEDVADERWRIRVVNQHALWISGCTGETLFGENAKQPHLEKEIFAGAYKGGKWGIYLRAPDLFFELLERAQGRLVPLSVLADVRFGVKSGADDFFFVKDVTDEEISKCCQGRPASDPKTIERFITRWGIPPKETETTRIVEAGDGSRHLIERRFLDPVVRSLMEIDQINIEEKNLHDLAVLISDSPAELSGTYASKYIKWGEREGFDQRDTCKGRQGAGRYWYDIKLEPWPGLILPKIQQYRHIVSLNPNGFQVNSNLLEVRAKADVPSQALAAILNSTIVAFNKQFYGRIHGREASLQLDVYAAQILPVPDARLLSGDAMAQRVSRAFKKLQARRVNALDLDLSAQDRQSLDDAALTILGFDDAKERERFLSLLYNEVRGLFREARRVEKEVQADRRSNARKGRVTPRSLAEEIWANFDRSLLRRFPAAFMREGESVEKFDIPSGKAVLVHDLFDRGIIRVGKEAIRFDSDVRARFALQVINERGSGALLVPQDLKVCTRILPAYQKYREQIDNHFQRLAEERTADSEMQKKDRSRAEKVRIFSERS